LFSVKNTSVVYTFSASFYPVKCYTAKITSVALFMKFSKYSFAWTKMKNVIIFH
jgi:hypothetical protein